MSRPSVLAEKPLELVFIADMPLNFVFGLEYAF